MPFYSGEFSESKSIGMRISEAKNYICRAETGNIITSSIYNINPVAKCSFSHILMHDVSVFALCLYSSQYTSNGNVSFC